MSLRKSALGKNQARLQRKESDEEGTAPIPVQKAPFRTQSRDKDKAVHLWERHGLVSRLQKDGRKLRRPPQFVAPLPYGNEQFTHSPEKFAHGAPRLDISEKKLYTCGMNKLLTDIHTHTSFSTDGKEDVFTMLKRARELKLGYWGISEHFDYDYYVDGISFDGEPARYTDAESYFSTLRKLQSEVTDLCILAGGEFGFTRNKEVIKYYHALIERYKPDFIVNSVHTQGKYDWYEKAAFAGKTKKQAYLEYLSLVRDSLDAEYPYDIVGHLGYAARFAPYEDRKMEYSDFAEEIDDILKAIAAREKILEVNSSVKGMDTSFLPFVEILERYYELGGREVSYASDAHFGARLAAGREEVVATLKKIGFTCLTVPCRGEKIKVEI